jgi:hypothetical protein
MRHYTVGVTTGTHNREKLLTITPIMSSTTAELTRLIAPDGMLKRRLGMNRRRVEDRYRHSV